MQVLEENEIQEVSGGLYAQCVSDAFAAGAIAGGVVGFYSGGGVGLGVGVGLGGLGGLIGGLFLCD